MFQACSVLGGTYNLFRTLGMLSFSVMKLIAAFEIKKSLGPGTRFREKTMICLSQARPFSKSHHFVYVVYMHALASAR